MIDLDTATEQLTEISLSKLKPPTTFFDLPRELRDKIYEYAVVQGAPACPFHLRWRRQLDDTSRTMATPLQPQLALVSRQTRDEVLEVFFSRNVFNFQPYPCGYARSISSFFIDTWRLAMGEHLRHLRRIIRLKSQYVQNPGHAEGARKRYIFSIYSLSLVGGIVTVQHQNNVGKGRQEERCVCWLQREVRASAGYDGRVLLDLVQRRCAVVEAKDLGWVHCKDCKLYRLVVVATRDGVAG